MRIIVCTEIMNGKSKRHWSSVGSVRLERPPVVSFGIYAIVLRPAFLSVMSHRTAFVTQSGLATTDRIFRVQLRHASLHGRHFSHYERTVLNVVNLEFADQRCLA